MEEDFSKKLEQTNKKIEELEEKNTLLESEIKGIKTEKRMRRDLKLRVSKSQRRYNEEIKPIFDELNKRKINKPIDLLSYVVDFINRFNTMSKEKTSLYNILAFTCDFLEKLRSIISMSNGEGLELKSKFLHRINTALVYLYDYLSLARSMSNDQRQIAELYNNDSNFELLNNLITDLQQYLKAIE